MPSNLLTSEELEWCEERARQRCANVLYADQEIERGPQQEGIVLDLKLALLKGIKRTVEREIQTVYEYRKFFLDELARAIEDGEHAK